MHSKSIGFDDLGRQFDSEGNLKDWWLPETKAHFLTRAKCIIDQYANFTEPKLKMKVSHSCLKSPHIFQTKHFCFRSMAETRKVKI